MDRESSVNSIPVLRTGIDLIEVERFRTQKPEIRQRFIDRVYTEREQEYCGDNDQHLADVLPQRKLWPRHWAAGSVKSAGRKLRS